MKGVRNIYYHPYTFSFLAIFIIFHHDLSIHANTLSSTESLTISSNQTIASPGGVFELGFFQPSAARWYLGIWHKEVEERVHAWVANRDNPLTSSTGTLKISGMNLVLSDHSSNIVWSTNLTRGNVGSLVVAELLDNGNLVVKHSDNNNNNSSGFLWQSFDYPTDTLLPEMKLGFDIKRGLNRFLTSWRSQDDPSSGNFTYKLDTRRGLPECFMWDTKKLLRSGPWDGIQLNGVPEGQELDYMVYNFTESREEVAYTFLVTNRSIYPRLTVSTSRLTLDTWNSPQWGWRQIWSFRPYGCDLYSFCGPNAYCDPNTSPMPCNCIGGFDPKDPVEWSLRDGSSGCVRRTNLTCNGDGFLRLERMKLPDSVTAILERDIDEEKCKEKCLKDCNCTAFANMYSGCVVWSGDLIDLRNFPVSGGQDLYVKVASADLGQRDSSKGKIIGWSVGVSLMLLLSFIVFCFWKRRQMRAKATATAPIVHQEVLITRGEDTELPLMELETVKTATGNFSGSNKVGKGGYGIVYKGMLPDGQEIAVKRLSGRSGQGTAEFMNEVRLIARLQHIHLVRLLGCCVDEGEKILIYEYLENLSLDSHLFDKSKSCKLNWQIRFDIINGIARGLLYLHQESRGYMAPEYAIEGIISMKSDVYSFGVLLIEIISGMKNPGYYNSDCSGVDLIGSVWMNWEEGQGLDSVDTIITDSLSTFRPYEILRCIQIGLLCVQEHDEDRPTMSSVILMLGSETTAIPRPKPPGYCGIGTSSLETDLSCKQRDNESCTVNHIAISTMNRR